MEKKNKSKEENLKNDNSNKPLKKGLKRYVKLHTLIIILILLIFNSYAWFIYLTKASAGITAHVSSWDIAFTIDETQQAGSILIDVGNIYPGMDTYTKSVNIRNSGEATADITFEYKSFTILGQTYTVDENCTQEELNNKIANDYPFKISVTLDKSRLDKDGYSVFTVNVSWSYESGNDTVDTYWGEQSYEYNKLHPTESSLKLEIKLIAKQINT